MNRPLPDFCAFKLQLLLLPLHKAPVRSPTPKAFITGFIRLKLHSPLSMVGDKGLEPLREHMILSHARLPIPPIPHVCTRLYLVTGETVC